MKYQKQNLFKEAGGYFIQNPGFFISFLYVSMTLCGIFYASSFYSEFDINILKLADISDMMTFGISDPAALIMFSGGILVAWSGDFWFRRSYDIAARWRDRPRSLKRWMILYFWARPPKTLTSAALTLLFFFVSYSWLFISLYADWRADRIKAGNGEAIELRLSGEDQGRRYGLLGSTKSYLIVYDQRIDQATVIMIENLLTVRPSVGKSGSQAQSGTE